MSNSLWLISREGKCQLCSYFKIRTHSSTAEWMCNDPRAAGTPDRMVTDLILVMEKSEECRSEWVQENTNVYNYKFNN